MPQVLEQSLFLFRKGDGIYFIQYDKMESIPWDFGKLPDTRFLETS